MKYNAAEMKRTSHQKKTDHRSGVGAPLLMSEVLSSPGEADRPLYLQEYWALDLIDFSRSYQHDFVIHENCLRWSELDRAFVGDTTAAERFRLLIDAEARFEFRRSLLLEKGLVHSDKVI
jgi:hypothetical protein